MSLTAIAVRRRHRARVLVASVAVGALVLAACGDDDDNSAATTAGGAATTAGGAATTSGGGGSATTASGGGSATTAGGGGGGGETGAPIKVMTETAIDTNLTPYENIRDASKYYAQWVNEQGGIPDGNGVLHKLEVTFCDDKYDANEAANCARKAVDAEARRQHRRVHDRCQPGHPDLRGEQGRLVRGVLPDRRPGEQVADLLPVGLRRGLPDCRRDQDEPGRLQEGRRRQWRPAGRRGVPQPVPQRLEVGRPHRRGDSRSSSRSPQATTARRWPRSPTTPTASSATSARPTGRPCSPRRRSWARSCASTARRATSTPRSPRTTRTRREGAVIMGVYPDITSEVFADYRAALEKYDAPTGRIDRLELPRWPGHLDGLRGVRRHREPHEG